MMQNRYKQKFLLALKIFWFHNLLFDGTWCSTLRLSEYSLHWYANFFRKIKFHELRFVKRWWWVEVFKINLNSVGKCYKSSSSLSYVQLDNNTEPNDNFIQQIHSVGCKLHSGSCQHNSLISKTIFWWEENTINGLLRRNFFCLLLSFTQFELKTANKAAWLKTFFLRTIVQWVWLD